MIVIIAQLLAGISIAERTAGSIICGVVLRGIIRPDPTSRTFDARLEQHVSLDLIELALDRMTDFAAFERLATEVMYLDGWHDIKPLGGTSDLGQDAVSERFFRQAAGAAHAPR